MPDTARQAKASIGYYTGLFAACLLFAYLQRVTEAFRWRGWQGVSQSREAEQVVFASGLLLLEFILCSANSIYLKRRATPLLNLLISCTIGATLLTLAGPHLYAVGVVLGAVCWCLATWSQVGRVELLLATSLFALGGLFGWLAYWGFVLGGQGLAEAEGLIVITLLAVGAWLVRRVNQQVRGTESSTGRKGVANVLGFVAYLACAIAGLTLTFLTDSAFLMRQSDRVLVRRGEGLLMEIVLNQESRDEDIDFVRRVPLLVGLSLLRGCQVTDEGFQRIPLRRLRRFHCGPQCHLSDASIRRLPFQQLESIELHGEQFTNAALGDDPIVFKRANVLVLRHTSLDSDGFRQIASAPRLRWLDAAHSDLDDRILAQVADWSVTFLDLSHTRVTGSGLQCLEDGVVWLDLSYTPLMMERLADLSPPGAEQDWPWVPTLHRLKLRGHALKPETLTQLARILSLTELDIADSSLPPGAAAQWSALRLRSLTLDADELSVSAVAQLFLNLPTLRELTLSFDAAATTFAEVETRLLAQEAACPQLGVRCEIRGLNLTPQSWSQYTSIGDRFECARYLRDVTLPDGSVLERATVHELLRSGAVRDLND
jgi:hypothetical protein